MPYPLFSKITLREHELLAGHTTFRIGGPAAFFALPEHDEELEAVVTFADDHDLPVFCLGRGSNILFADDGYSGVVLSMTRFRNDFISRDSECITVSAGCTLGQLVAYAKETACGGLEFLCSIPGTVGGAIRRNASFGRTGEVAVRSMADCVCEITFFDGVTKRVRTIARDELSFSYRQCQLPPGIIMSAKLAIQPTTQKCVETELKKNYNYRTAFHDMKHPSAGCVFKNPVDSSLSAGYLIDQCGLKGLRIGDACVSKRHANYIINIGAARAQDVLALIERIRTQVAEHFEVELETEIEYVIG